MAEEGRVETDDGACLWTATSSRFVMLVKVAGKDTESVVGP